MAWWVYVSVTRFDLSGVFAASIFQRCLVFHEYTTLYPFFCWWASGLLGLCFCIVNKEGCAEWCGLVVRFDCFIFSRWCQFLWHSSHLMPPPPHALSRSPLLLQKPLSTLHMLDFNFANLSDEMLYLTMISCKKATYLLFFCYHPFLPIAGF